VEPETGGDPEGHAKYTRRSLRSLAKRLGCASSKTVGRLLKGMDYSLRTNVKRLAGKPHPHRDRQYRFIQRAKALFRRHGDPVISVDAKKTELVGNFKNAGECWCVVPEEVNMYDFPSDATGKATPYGMDDQVANHAYVVVGMSAVTAAFAVACIRRWWATYGRERYPDSHHIMIECDGGGCNGHRPRLWKHELQQLSDDTGLSITVCHYPSGASKWNPIEHRVFSQISSNWAGYPLRSLRRILGFIRGTATETGLTVDADVDPRTYEKGIKISDQEMRTLNLTRRRLCPNLNYTIRPRQSGNS
jgi:Rhodopirellula transposase DDE domain